MVYRQKRAVAEQDTRASCRRRWGWHRIASPDAGWLCRRICPTTTAPWHVACDPDEANSQRLDNPKDQEAKSERRGFAAWQELRRAKYRWVAARWSTLFLCPCLLVYQSIFWILPFLSTLALNCAGKSDDEPMSMGRKLAPSQHWCSFGQSTPHLQITVGRYTQKMMNGIYAIKPLA